MPNVNVNETFFKTITGTFEILPSDNVIAFSITVLDGTCSMSSAGTYRGLESEVIDLPAGSVYTETASPYSVLGHYGFAVTGSVLISIKK